MIKSKKASTIPGDARRVLTARATDSEGRVWPSGTVYTPGAAGSHTRGFYQTVYVAGQPVTFLEA
jgi:hypothetical protein